MQQTSETFCRTTSGRVIDPAMWVRRKIDAAELVRKRFLTLREAAEQFALPVEEIATAH